MIKIGNVLAICGLDWHLDHQVNITCEVYSLYLSWRLDRSTAGRTGERLAAYLNPGYDSTARITGKYKLSVRRTCE